MPGILLLSRKSVCVCLRAFPPLRLLIASWMIWCDMDPILLVDVALELKHVVETNIVRVS